MPTCSYCGAECAPSPSGLCPRCVSRARVNELRRCWSCDRYHLASEMTEVSAPYGEVVRFCPSCVDEYTRVCTFCGRRYVIWQGNSAQDGSGQHSCPSCGHRLCHRCGRLAREVWVYDDQVLCANCVDTEGVRALDRVRDEGLLKAFDFKPRFKKHATSRVNDGIYLGVELEAGFLPTETERAKILCAVTDILGDACYTKHDGSVPRWGFEVVSHPMTLKYHKERNPWQQVLSTMVASGMRTEPTQEELNEDEELHEHPCGLHIHINKDALTYNQWVKLDWLIQSNKYFWYALARRGHTRYAKFKSLRQVHFGMCKLSDVCGRSETRYFSVNFCNKSTVELRFFNSTLDYTTLIASLELAHALVTWARSVTINDILTHGAQSTFISTVRANKASYPTASLYIADVLGR